jgi:hypothetical protein
MAPRKWPIRRVSKLPKQYEYFERYYQVQKLPTHESLLKLLEKGQSATDFMSAILMRPWSIAERIQSDSVIEKDDSSNALKRLLKVSNRYLHHLL